MGKGLLRAPTVGKNAGCYMVIMLDHFEMGAEVRIGHGKRFAEKMGMMRLVYCI